MFPEDKLPKEAEKKTFAFQLITALDENPSKDYLITNFLPILQLHLVKTSFLITVDRPHELDTYIYDKLQPLLTSNGIKIETYPSIMRWTSVLEFCKDSKTVEDSNAYQTFEKLFLDPAFKLIQSTPNSTKSPEIATKIKKSSKDKAKKAKKPEKSAKTSDVPDISKLEIRIGEIVTVDVHPEREKLFVFDISFGEGNSRKICSGIVAHYPEKSVLLNKKVLVACNLKPRNMGSIPSQGMVLCVTANDKVAILEPPVGTDLNERILFEGLDISAHEPFKPNKMAKQKVLEKLVASKAMISDDKGRVLWKSHQFKTSKGLCQTKLFNGLIS